jgi:superfamily II DNA or RNA helicase
MRKLQNAYTSEDFRLFELNLPTLSKHQKEFVKCMIKNDKYTICMPTGCGKSMIIYRDMIDHLKSPSCDTFVIASHRLMLNSQHFDDLFRDMIDVTGSIGYIFVGSSNVDVNNIFDIEDKDDLLLKQKFNRKMKELGIKNEELISSATRTDEVKRMVSEHKDAGRDVIIITTYHSMDKLKDIDIHTLYCDEAHLLATEKLQSDFKENFEKIQKNVGRKFFFTATPRDLVDKDDPTDTFLMNNKDIFGDRIDLSFRESVEEGYIVRPAIHIAEPENFEADKKYQNTENYVKYIIDTYKEHCRLVKEKSVRSESINGKMLVKCPSVEVINKVMKKLVEVKKEKDSFIKDVDIFAGYSANDKIDDPGCHFKNGEIIDSRKDFLDSMKKVPNEVGSIILHYDILSEGINVPGITGVMFLSDKLPTLPKILQNIGRSTRLHWEDRKNLLSNGISTNDLSLWIKPYCWVILPVTSYESSTCVNNIADICRRLRDQYDFDPAFIVSMGEDVSSSGDDDDMADRNVKDKKESKGLVEQVIHTIEDLDKKRNIDLEYERIKKLAEDDPENEFKMFADFCDI